MIIPKQFALKFSPPALIMEYYEDDGRSRKRRRRFMPVRKLSKQDDPGAVASKLAKLHERFLNERVVSSAQLRRLMRILIEHVNTDERKGKTSLSESMNTTLDEAVPDTPANNKMSSSLANLPQWSLESEKVVEGEEPGDDLSDNLEEIEEDIQFETDDLDNDDLVFDASSLKR